MPAPVLDLPTVHEDDSGAIAPARIRAIDLTDGLAFAEIFSLSLCRWITEWRPLSSFWLN